MYHTHLDYSQARRQEGMHGNWPEGGSERARPRERWLLCLALGPKRSSIKQHPLEEGITEKRAERARNGALRYRTTVIQLLRRAERVIATRCESTSTRAST